MENREINDENRAKVLKKLASNMTQEEIAKEMNISQSAVSKIKLEAMEKFQQLVKEGVPIDRIAEKFDLPVPFVQLLVKKQETKIEKTRSPPPNIFPNTANTQNITQEPQFIIKENRRKNMEEDQSTEESAYAKYLRAILSQVKIPQVTIEAIMEIYKEDEDLYNNYPNQLWNVLTGLDVKPNKANLIVNRFTTMLYGPMGQPSYYIQQPIYAQPQQWPQERNNSFHFNPSISPPIPFNQTIPTFSPPYPQYIPFVERREKEKTLPPEEEEYQQRKKERARERDEMRDMIIDMQMAAALRNATGGLGTGLPGMSIQNPNVIVSYEPILDKDGAPVFDKFGQPLMRVIQQPIQAVQLQSKTEHKESTMESAIIKALERSQEQLQSMSEKISELSREQLEDRIQELSQQVNYLAQKDPLSEFINKIKLLKEEGFVGEQKNRSEDFEKWKYEREMDFKQWMVEREDKWREMEMQRQQMARVTEGVKDIVGQVGGPLAQAVASGYVAEKQAQSRSNMQTQTTTQTQTTQQIDFSKLSDDELQARYAQLQQAKQTIANYEQKIREEYDKRKPQVRVGVVVGGSRESEGST